MSDTLNLTPEQLWRDTVQTAAQFMTLQSVVGQWLYEPHKLWLTHTGIDWVLMDCTDSAKLVEIKRWITYGEALTDTLRIVEQRRVQREP